MGNDWEIQPPLDSKRFRISRRMLGPCSQRTISDWKWFRLTLLRHGFVKTNYKQHAILQRQLHLHQTFEVNCYTISIRELRYSSFRMENEKPEIYNKAELLEKIAGLVEMIIIILHLILEWIASVSPCLEYHRMEHFMANCLKKVIRLQNRAITIHIVINLVECDVIGEHWIHKWSEYINSVEIFIIFSIQAQRIVKSPQH